jgi:uncharacterized membrane protein
MLFATTNLTGSTERAPSLRPRRLRPGPRAQRRRGCRLELERVEERCLLSSYSITALTYPGGYLQTAAAINNLGQVAGRGSYPMNNAVVWQNGSITNLDPQQVHGTISYAIDLTNPAPGHEADVQVVGGIDLGYPKQDVFLWAGGTMYDTLIPFSNPSVGGNALAISNAGVVAGSFAPGGDPSQNHAFVWIDNVVHNHILDPGELRDLNSLFPNATSSSADDIIDATAAVPHRQIVANAYVPVKGGGQQWRAYLLTDKKDNGFASGVQVAALGTLSGGLDSHAFAINNVGQIAGDSGGNSFRWQNGVLTNLGHLNNLNVGSEVINNSGTLVGVAGSAKAPSSGAWIWTGSGPIQNLKGLIPKKSDWTSLSESHFGINDAGKIVGIGHDPTVSNNTVAYLLNPISGASPAAAADRAKVATAVIPGAVPRETTVQSSPPSNMAPRSKTVGPDSLVLVVPLIPVRDQDVTMIGTDVVRAGMKRPRSFFAR